MTALEEVSWAIALKLSEHNFAAGPLDYMPLAIAAVKALREPSEEQYQAISDSGLMWKDQSSTSVYRTMIDAILSEPQTSSKPLPSLEGQGPEMTQDQIQAMERGGK